MSQGYENNIFKVRWDNGTRYSIVEIVRLVTCRTTIAATALSLAAF